MFTGSWLPTPGETAHHVFVGFGLAVIALVGFAYGAAILATASPATSTGTLALGVSSLVVCFGALIWLTKLFVDEHE